MRRGDKITVPTDDEVDYIRRNAPRMTDKAIAEGLVRVFGNPVWNRKRVAYVRRKNDIPNPGHRKREMKVGAVRNCPDKGKPRLMIKAGDNPRRWVLYARYLWEKERGPVPAGCVVVHADGDPLNCDIGNLRCITKSEHCYNAGKRVRFDSEHRAAIGAGVSKYRAYVRRKKAAEIYLAHKPYEFAR